MIKSFLRYSNALILVILFTGCSTAEIKVPEKQYIPVKCQINKPNKPSNYAKDKSDYEGILLNAKSMAIYTELLEKDLNFCVEGVIK